jgi:hypothetical protein
MSKVIKLTESDLEMIVKRVIEEQSVIGAPNMGITNKPQAAPKPLPQKGLSAFQNYLHHQLLI